MQERTDHGRAGWSGLVILSSVGLVSFAVSYTHMHRLFDTNGQTGWVAWALATVVEMLAAGGGLELVRRSRAGESAALPITILCLGVGMTLWGNLATAKRGTAGHLVAAFPAISTLLILAVLETARAAAQRRSAVAREQRDEHQAELERLAAQHRAVVERISGQARRDADEAERLRGELAAAVEARAVAETLAEQQSARADRAAARAQQLAAETRAPNLRRIPVAETGGRGNPGAPSRKPVAETPRSAGRPRKYPAELVAAIQERERVSERRAQELIAGDDPRALAAAEALSSAPPAAGGEA